MTQGTRNILILDDEPNIGKALSRLLKRENYNTIVCDDPHKALGILKTTPVDLVISDNLMPQMTGLEFLKLVHDRHPHVLRVMLTGHADMQTAIEGINQNEIYRFITKPWVHEEMLLMVSLAFEDIDTKKKERELLAMARNQLVPQLEQKEELEKEHPGISKVRYDADGAIVIN